MRCLAYLLAGAFVVLAMDMIAPPAGLGWAVGAGPEAGAQQVLQYVDRTGKGDRLIPSVTKRPKPVKRPAVMVGCDPAFSPLSTSAHANFAARCMA